MCKKTCLIIFFLVLCLSVSITSVQADGSGQTIDTIDKERFALAPAMRSMQSIHDWLESFKALTTLTEDRITPEEKKQVGSIGFDTQSLAFYNLPKLVEGTLLKQHYDISKLEYELALERLASGKVSQLEAAAKKKKYQEARADLQGFLDKFRVVD